MKQRYKKKKKKPEPYYNRLFPFTEAQKKKRTEIKNQGPFFW